MATNDSSVCQRLKNNVTDVTTEIMILFMSMLNEIIQMTSVCQLYYLVW